MLDIRIEKLEKRGRVISVAPNSSQDANPPRIIAQQDQERVKQLSLSSEAQKQLLESIAYEKWKSFYFPREGVVVSKYTRRTRYRQKGFFAFWATTMDEKLVIRRTLRSLLKAIGIKV